METKMKCKKNKITEKFKSYYVVWKLTDDEKEEIEKFGLNRTM